MLKSIAIRFLFILLISLSVLSCSRILKKSGSDLPENVLEKELMTAVITDIHLIEAALAQKQRQGTSDIFNIAEIYYDTLMAKHSITRIQIDSSISYYSRRPELFEVIYANVITNLSKRESEPKREEAEDEIVEDEADSIEVHSPELSPDTHSRPIIQEERLD